MAKPSQPSNLELQALSVLWHEGPSTVSAVHGALPDGRERAYTTVLSVMQSLERKKLVKRIRSGRAHVYEPAHPQEVIVRRATDDFVTNAFGGRLGEAVLATLSIGSLTPEEKTNIERELQRHKTMAAKKKSAKKPVRKKAPAKKKVAAKKKAPAKKKVAAKKKAPAKKKVAAKKKAPAKKKVAAKKKAPAKKKVAAKKKAPAKKKVAAKKKAPAKKKVAAKKKAPAKKNVAAKKRKR
ncbi:MAG: BlaI/MecI/CopY family transcriptional regulator [Akkermansiaceae bacterium]